MRHDRGISTTGNIVVFEAFKRYSDDLPMVVPDNEQQPVVLEEVEGVSGSVDYLTGGRTMKVRFPCVCLQPGAATSLSLQNLHALLMLALYFTCHFFG